MTESECYAIIHRDLGSDTSLLVRVRMGDGVDMERFRELCCAMRELRNIWHGRELVPKAVACRLVEVRTLIWAQREWYKGEERERVERAADELGQLAEAVLLDSPPTRLEEPCFAVLDRYLGAGADSLVSQVASGGRMRGTRYDKVCQALRELELLWAGQREIPRPPLKAMQDILPRVDQALWRCSKAERDEIFAAAVKISDLIGAVMYSD